jgi:hypothetical protein
MKKTRRVSQYISIRLIFNYFLFRLQLIAFQKAEQKVNLVDPITGTCL